MDDVDARAAARRLAAAEREALLPHDTTPLLPARRKRATAVATMVLGLLALSVGVTVVHQRLEKEQKLDVDRDAAWTAFKAKYEKTYATPAHEKAARRNYEARLASMDERNRINGEAVFGVTRHADREMGHNAFARGHRRAERRDILPLARLLHDAFALPGRSPLDAAWTMGRLAIDIETRLTPWDWQRHAQFVAETDGELVAFCELWGEDVVSLGKEGAPTPQPCLFNLCVRADQRRRGVGAELIRECEALSRAWKQRTLFLKVRADNDGAERKASSVPTWHCFHRADTRRCFHRMRFFA